MKSGITIGITIYCFLLFITSTNVQTIETKSLFDYRLSLGSKSPYIPPHTELRLMNMTLKQVHLISRHGSRYWTRKKHLALFDVADYLKLHVDSKIHPQIANLTIPFDKESAAQIAPIGIQSTHDFGQRFKKRYPKFLVNEMKSYSSSSPRAIDSLHSFLRGFGYNNTLEIVIQNRTLDADLNPELACTKFGILAKENPMKNHGKLWMGQYIDELVQRMNRLVGIPLTKEQVKTILEICAVQISLLGYRRTEGLCYLLSTRDLQNYEIFDDVQKFNGFSYGNEFNANIACSLITSLVKDISNKDRLVTVRFTHAETIIPLITALGMFKDDYPISGSMSFEQLRKRKFHSSHFSPFQGNLIVEVYDCEQETCLRLLINERPVLLPNCNYINGVCPLAEFKRVLSRFNGCNFDQLCQNDYTTTGGWNS